ncbi:MAG: hypothetical protein JWM87_3442 [Candidatus Eremiobacteraeota bacterium]|nr:hypothetical protein [Candidatus Eremiobacteraeota bacterium]
MIHRFSAAAAAVIALLLPAASGAAAPATLPDAVPDWSSVDFLIGTWTCEATFTARPGVKRSKAAFRYDFDRRWLREDITSPPFDQFRTRQIDTVIYTTYSPYLKKWISTGLDNFGRFGTSRSDGWHGDTIVWEDDEQTSGARAAESLTRVDATHTRDVFRMRNADGTLQAPSAVQTCAKDR